MGTRTETAAALGELRATVSKKYGEAAMRVMSGETAEVCSGSSGCCGATTEAWDPITSDLYDEKQAAGLPPEALLASLGCVAGAIEENEFLSMLIEVGFEQPSIEPTRVYRAADAAAFLAGTGLDANEFASQIEGKFISAFVRATKPEKKCCGSDCCA